MCLMLLLKDVLCDSYSCGEHFISHVSLTSFNESLIYTRRPEKTLFLFVFYLSGVCLFDVFSFSYFRCLIFFIDFHRKDGISVSFVPASGPVVFMSLLNFCVFVFFFFFPTVCTVSQQLRALNSTPGFYPHSALRH